MVVSIYVFIEKFEVLFQNTIKIINIGTPKIMTIIVLIMKQFALTVQEPW